MCAYKKLLLGLGEERSDETYLFTLLSLNLSLIVFGDKPANLICFSEKTRNMKSLWKKEKALFSNSKLKYIELKDQGDYIAILFYQEKLLEERLNRKDESDFLENLGYAKDLGLEDKLEILKKRFNQGAFDEIGIFLGYPLDDVTDFFSKKKKAKATGYWKVFNNMEESQRIFCYYDQIKRQTAKILSNISSKDFLLTYT